MRCLSASGEGGSFGGTLPDEDERRSPCEPERRRCLRRARRMCCAAATDAQASPAQATRRMAKSTRITTVRIPKAAFAPASSAHRMGKTVQQRARCLRWFLCFPQAWTALFSQSIQPHTTRADPARPLVLTPQNLRSQPGVPGHGGQCTFARVYPAAEGGDRSGGTARAGHGLWCGLRA